MKRLTVLLLTVMFGMFGLAACDDDSDLEDSFEQAGDNIGDAANDAGDAIEDGFDDVTDN